MRDDYVDLSDPWGNEIRYRRYAARVPEFLKVYPPKEGYRIECSTTDLLSHQTGLLSLLKEAIAAGRKLGDLGLPGLDGLLTTFVSTARLYDAQARLLRSASACASIKVSKDFERLETAADQRLLARLGFGGEIFNQEEAEEFAQQGLSATTSASDSASSEADIARPSESSPSQTPPIAAALLGGEQQSGEQSVPEALRIQVANFAKLLGQPVPTMKTQADAEAAMRELGEVQKRRHTAVAA